MTATKEVHAAGDGPVPRPRSAVLYVSIVSDADGARLAVVSASEDECLTRVAAYVAEQAPLQLWPSSAQRIHELLASGDVAAAVAEFFRRSGERWDREWLVMAPLDPDPGTSTWSGAMPLPGRGQLSRGGLTDRRRDRTRRFVTRSGLPAKKEE